MENSEKPKLGNTSTDIVVSLTKGTTGMIPFVGSLVAEIVGNVIPNQRVDRIVRFVELLESRLDNVEQDVARQRMASPEAVDLLEDAFSQAARATTGERLEYISNVVANGFSADELKQAEVKRMLWLLGQLNDVEIIILRSSLCSTREEYEADAEFQIKHEEVLAADATHLGSSEEEFEAAAVKRSYRSHLHDLGLIRHRYKKPKRGELPEFDDSTGMMKTSGLDVTRLGRMFLHYLDLIPSWYQQ